MERGKENRMVQFIGNQGQPLLAAKPRRNGQCHCGSGKKLKHCCRTGTQYYLSKSPIAKQLENHKG